MSSVDVERFLAGVRAGVEKLARDHRSFLDKYAEEMSPVDYGDYKDGYGDVLAAAEAVRALRPSEFDSVDQARAAIRALVDRGHRHLRAWAG